MLTPDQIKALNIEMSSACNGKCPFCSRDQKIRPYGNHMISLADFKKLPETLVRQLKWITFAGNFGDLSSNPDMVRVAAYVKGLNQNVVLGGDTNGSMQSTDWWAALGEFFRDGSMQFAIDGLADTHAVHRKGTSFAKIIDNVKAFSKAGGVAHWKFIVFRHNEHQIEAAEKEAKRIGCKRFFVIPSRDYGGELEPPEQIDFQIKREVFKTYDEKLSGSETRATCKPLDNGSLYIAADGTVHPCCFAHCMYITEHNSLFDFLPPLAAQYYDEINFKTRPLEEILKGPYFEKILSLSQNNAYCRMKCNPFRKTVKKELLIRDVRF